jgi:hypothetical protein
MLTLCYFPSNEYGLAQIRNVSSSSPAVQQEECRLDPETGLALHTGYAEEPPERRLLKRKETSVWRNIISTADTVGAGIA